MKDRQPFYHRIIVIGIGFGLLIGGIHAQQAGPSQTQQPARPRPGPPTEPTVLQTNAQPIRVVPLATQLAHPWSVAFLPDGRILVTERPGRLRIIRDGKLDPTPVSGVPKVHAILRGGLHDVAVHPNFASNNFIYLAYAYEKPG